MNTTTKIFSLIGFVLAMSKDLSGVENERVAWRAGRVLQAAERAGQKYPASQLKPSQIRRIKRAVMALERFGFIGPDKKKLTVILAFVLCGIDEVLGHTRNTVTRELFQDLEKKVLWLNALVDPRLDSDADYVKGEYFYEQWATGQLAG